MKLNQSELITERNFLSNSNSEADNIHRQGTLNNTVSQFNV